MIYKELAEGQGVAYGKKIMLKRKKKVEKKFNPIRSSRLANQREHIYKFLVLLFRYIPPFEIDA